MGNSRQPVVTSDVVVPFPAGRRVSSAAPAMNSPGASAHDELVGRQPELDALDVFLTPTAGDGGALALSGGAGLGKTALLDQAVTLALGHGLDVLRTEGVTPAAGAAFSGLRKFLTPLLGTARGLPGDDRRVIEVALGHRDGEPPGMLRVTSALLSLVQWARPRRRLLVVIDDVHRMDPVSRQVLCVLGAQLDGTGVRLLCAGHDLAGDGGFPARALEPLGEGASRALLNRRFPMLAARVRRRILAEARGNPLALVELPLALSSTQRTAAAALPPVLPLTERLRAVHGPRVRSLPPGTRELLLAAAFEGTGDLNVLRAVAEHDFETALRTAEDARLAGVDPTRNRLVFRHPLVRATVVALASSGQRRAVHGRLARTLRERPELHAWHLSQSAITANSATANLAHDAAVTAMSRGAAVSAVRLMIRSADLSADPRLRAHRLGHAATMSADVAGDLDTAGRLVLDARETDPDFDDTLPALVAAATTLLNRDGDVEAAYGLLVAALDARTGAEVGNLVLLRTALWTLARSCWLGGRAESWESLLRLAGKYREQATEFEVAACHVVADAANADAADIAVIERELAAAPTEKDLTKIIQLAGPCSSIDRIGDLRAALWRVVENGRDGESITFAIRALTHLCADALARGRWSDVDILGSEALRLCEENEQQACSRVIEGSVAAVAALRGDTRTTALLTRGMIAWATPRDARTVLYLATHARVLEALGAADFEAAYQFAAEAGLIDAGGPTSIERMRMAFDLVEAAVHTRRHREAKALVRAIKASEMARLSPRLALHAAAAAALAAPRDRASTLFEIALALPGASRWPFDHARVQLAHGEHLRRLRATGEAQRQLRGALTTFRDLGALPWAARAEIELRAAGDRGVVGGPAHAATLTPQELEIVRLAADGLTNKQIGQRLYLSSRTVGNHLYRAFPKLGITSRVNLRDALDTGAARQGPARHQQSTEEISGCPSRPTKRWRNDSSTSTTPTYTR